MFSFFLFLTRETFPLKWKIDVQTFSHGTCINESSSCFPGFSPSVVSITSGQEPISSAGKGFFILFSVADPDLQIRMGAGRGGHPDPKIRGSRSQDNVFQPSGPQFSLKIKGGPSGAAAPQVPPVDPPLIFFRLFVSTFCKINCKMWQCDFLVN